MKLKYYLRGVGIGIIFATLVMTVSSLVHKYNLSDEYIIKEARKLGMVMQDEVKDEENGLWGGSDSDDTYLEVTEETETTETDVVPETEIESESESESQEPEVPVVNEDASFVTIEVVSGDTPRKVGEKLAQAGENVDPEAFMKYVGERGLAQKLRKGTYKIPKGASFEEICDILF